MVWRANGARGELEKDDNTTLAVESKRSREESMARTEIRIGKNSEEGEVPWGIYRRHTLTRETSDTQNRDIEKDME